MAALPVSDHAVDDAPALPLSDTVRKVDRAVARLEELQCMVRTSRTSAVHAKRSPPPCRSKLALHAGDRFPYRNSGNGAPQHAQHACNSKPALPTTCRDLDRARQHVQHVRSSKPGVPVAASRRSARVAAFPPQPPQRKVLTSRRSASPCEMQSPPRIPQASPPSSACSSSVQVVARRARPIKDSAPSKLPRTFFVDAGPANPNRPWCLSSSPSPATTSSTTSNYIYTPSSSSSFPALATKSPSRFSPLHRQISTRKNQETHQLQPLLCKSPECVAHSTIKPIKTSPHHPRKTPAWFSQTRLSLPTLAAPSPTKKRSTRRFSLAPNTHQDSPPRPLPSLITRLPMRRKKTLSPDDQAAAGLRRKSTTAGLTPNASPQKAKNMVRRRDMVALSSPLQSPSKWPASPPIPPLPLPPALQAPPPSTHLLPTLLSSCKKKASHKRSSSCPRQCLLPLADGGANVNHPAMSSSPLPAKLPKGASFHRNGKENCFSGCGPTAWPCLRKSWSCCQQPSPEHSDFTGAGPYLVRQVKGYMQNGMNMNSQVYKVDSFKQASDGDRLKVYIG